MPIQKLLQKVLENRNLVSLDYSISTPSQLGKTRITVQSTTVIFTEKHTSLQYHSLKVTEHMPVKESRYLEPGNPY